MGVARSLGVFRRVLSNFFFLFFLFQRGVDKQGHDILNDVEEGKEEEKEGGRGEREIK